MANNIFQPKLIQEAEQRWKALREEIGRNVAVLESFRKETMNLPSDYVNNLKKIKDSQDKLKKSTNDAVTTQKKWSSLQKEQIRLNQQIHNTSVKKISSTTREAQVLAKVKFETQQNNRATREAALLSSSLANAYQKAVVRMNQAAKSVQNLTAKRLLGVKLSKSEQIQLEKSTMAFNKYHKAVIGADAAVKRFNRNVGNYPKGLKAAASAVRSLAAAFGFTGGVFLFASAIKDAFNRIREFDKAMQNIAGILRTNRESLKDLEEEIIKVAGASVKTSREVAELAEALVTLGKTKSEIKDMLEPVNNLAIGLETTSEEAAEFLVQTLNAFGAGSDEAEKYADTIATIRTSTTLDFQRMRDSFQYLTPISRILNKDLAYTGSVIGILADNGLKAEQAGRLLGTAQQKLAAEGKSLNDALDEINQAYREGKTELEILKTASDLFGKQAAKVGAILAQNTDEIEKNAQAIRDNGGALDDLVKQQLDSLDAKLKIVDSTWESFILNMDNGRSFIGKTTKAVLDLVTAVIKLNDFLLNSDGNEAQRRVINEQYESTKKLLDAQENSLDVLEATLNLNNKKLAQLKTEAKFDNLSEKQLEINEKQQLQQVGIIRALKDKIEQKKKDVEEEQKLLEIAQKNIRTVNEINKLIKAQQELLGETSTRAEAKAIQDRIKALERERDAILGVHKASMRRKRELPLMADIAEHYERMAKSAEKFNKLIGEPALENLRKELQKTIDEIGNVDLNIRTYTDLDFTPEEFAILEEQFNRLGELYDIDASKFTALFDDKENTVADYVAASGEAIKGLYSLFAVNYEEDLFKLQQSYQHQIRFAQEGTEAREELDRQYEQKRREIQNRQARQAKEQAIFESIINTATAVTKALSEGGLVLAAIVAALGAAEIAAISAQSVPQFYDGTEDTGRGGNVDNRGGFNAVLHPNERVMTKDQNKRMHGYSNEDVANIVNNYHKGSLFEIELNKMLNSNGILPERPFLPMIKVENNSLSAQDFNKGIRNLERAINKSSKPSNVTVNLKSEERFSRRVTSQGKRV